MHASIMSRVQCLGGDGLVIFSYSNVSILLNRWTHLVFIVIFLITIRVFIFIK